jgi:hypothetical protein
MEHSARAGADNGLVGLEILASRHRGADIAEFLEVVSPGCGQRFPHGGQRCRWRTGGILVGIQPHHVHGEIPDLDERSLRIGHLRQHANNRGAKTNTRGKSPSGEHGEAS